jgi:enoyl-CoA hydratase
LEKSYETIKWSVDEGIALVVINRPEALNALNSQVFTELDRIFTELKQNDRARVIILTGEGEKAFAAGADIKEEQQCSVMEARDFAMLANRTQRNIDTFPKPVIAAVNGFALGGGCEVAMSCDIRIASTNAKFGQPEINLGIIPGGGGTQRLSRLIGLGRAKELIFSGEMIDARRAYEIGLVNKVVLPEDLIDEARKLASTIARKSAPILRLAKEALNCGFDLDLDNALKFEIECFANCFGTEDHHEGITAFIEKRKPSFKDK